MSRAHFISRVAQGIFLLLALLQSAQVAHASPPGTMPLVASSDAHVWWIGEVAPVNGEETAWVLFHRALSDVQPTTRRAWIFSRAPEAISAYAREVWLIFPAEGNRAREVFQLAADRPEGSTHWLNASQTPSPRPPLAGEGLLRDFTIAKDGAFALFSDALREAPKLLRCDGASWEVDAWPTELRDPLEIASHLGVMTVDADGSVLLAQVRRASTQRESAHEIVLAKRTQTNATPSATQSASWSLRTLALPAHAARSLIANPRIGATIVEGRLIVGVGESPQPIELFDVRGESLLAWTSLDASMSAYDPPMRGSWSVVGMQSGARMIAFEDTQDGKALTARIAVLDVARGTVGPFTALEEAKLSPVHFLPMLLGLAAAALLLITMVVRPSPAAAAMLPPSTEAAASYSRRALAFAIDLLPGIVIAAFVFDLHPRDWTALGNFLFLTADVSTSGPSSLMLGASGILTILVETISGASIGKWIVGIRVASATGGEASIPRRLARAVLTLFAVFSPILLLATISHPRLRGVPELLTNTEVVTRR